MKLIIDISEDAYKAACNGYMLPPDVENVVRGIKNGTPLPKDHEKLIDAEIKDDTIPNEGSNHEFSDSIAKAAEDLFGIDLKRSLK